MQRIINSALFIFLIFTTIYSQSRDQIGFSMGINKQVSSSFGLSLKYEKPILENLMLGGIGTFNLLGDNARIHELNYRVYESPDNEFNNLAIIEADNQVGIDVGLKYRFSDTWIQPYMHICVGFDYYWNTYEYDLIKYRTTQPGENNKIVTRESGSLFENSFSWLLGVQFQYSENWLIDTYVMDKMYTNLNQAVKFMVGFYYLI